MGKTRKLVIIISVLMLILIISFFPVRSPIKDGGSMNYISLSYQITRYHVPSTVVDDGKLRQVYLDGWRVKILNHVIYDDESRIYDEWFQNQKSVDEYKQSCENTH